MGLSGGAGLEVVENRYLCIRQRNAKKGIEWDRVYVHSVFRRPDDAEAVQASPGEQPGVQRDE